MNFDEEGNATYLQADIFEQTLVSETGEETVHFIIHPALLQLRRNVEIEVTRRVPPNIHPGIFHEMVERQLFQLIAQYPHLIPDVPFLPVTRSEPKAPSASKAHSVSVMGLGSSQATPPLDDKEVHESWLEGTNVHVTKKAQEHYRQNRTDGRELVSGHVTRPDTSPETTFSITGATGTEVKHSVRNKEKRSTKSKGKATLPEEQEASCANSSNGKVKKNSVGTACTVPQIEKKIGYDEAHESATYVRPNKKTECKQTGKNRETLTDVNIDAQIINEGTTTNTIGDTGVGVEASISVRSKTRTATISTGKPVVNEHEVKSKKVKKNSDNFAPDRIPISTISPQTDTSNKDHCTKTESILSELPSEKPRRRTKKKPQPVSNRNISTSKTNDEVHDVNPKTGGMFLRKSLPGVSKDASASNPTTSKVNQTTNQNKIVSAGARKKEGSSSCKENKSSRGFPTSKQFPLEMTHDYTICCDECLRQTDQLGHCEILGSAHKCAKDILAVREKDAKCWKRIRHRPSNNIYMKKYIRCKYFEQSAGSCKNGSSCGYAHSEEENELWTLEASKTFEIEKFIKLHGSKPRPSAKTGNDSKEDKQGNTPKENPSVPLKRYNTTKGTHKVEAQIEQQQEPKESQNKDAPSKNTVQQVKPQGTGDISQMNIMAVCGLCWKNGQMRSRRSVTSTQCSGIKTCHTWQSERIFLVMPARKIIRQPPSTKKLMKYEMCRSMQEKGKCDYFGNRCSFAHSDDELKIWKVLQANKVTKLEDIAKEIVETSTPKNAQTDTTPVTLPPFVPLRLPVYLHHCKFCDISYDNEGQLRKHCTTAKHIQNVNTDSEHQWDFRQPPWSVHQGKYSLCQKLRGGECMYTNTKQEHNMCLYAHSQDELEEWKKRYRYRVEKRRIARESHLYSYMDQLLEAYKESEAGISVLAEGMSGVVIESTDDLVVLTESITTQFSWTFQIETVGQTLDTVGLLLHNDRSRFSLHTQSTSDQTNCQLMDGPSMQQSSNSYQVQVKFLPGMFGTFSQWVVFDFGSRPVLVRKLQVDVGKKDILTKVKNTRERLNSERWTWENADIIKFPSKKTYAASEEVLQKQYKAPNTAAAVVNQETLRVSLNEENYIHKMHKLINLEELQRAQLIAGFGHAADLLIMKAIIEDNVFINSMPGQLFARLDLPDRLNKDTDAGRLILMSVQTVLLKNDARSQTIYEATIVNRENFDFDGRAHDHIYLCLSDRCVSDWNAEPNTTFKVAIQFQMDRMPFCKWHMALDSLQDLHNVFPVKSTADPVWAVDDGINVESEFLNEYQVKVVQCMFDHNKADSLPIIVCGPFGTGKTETFAQAAALLVSHDSEKTHILICTHSNSAADIYVEKYLHNFMAHLPDMELMRVYHAERRMNTIHEIVRKYCNISKDGTSLIMPKPSQVKQQNVIVTTFSTATYLLQMKKLRGHFTHIFIDEAAQALECEVLIPLALASRETCVVLAGDHMQMRQDVYCPEARQQGFDKTILENLQKRYQEQPSLENVMCHFLNLNYRTSPGILKFIASTFYADPDCIIPVHHEEDRLPRLPHMNFFTAQGREQHDSDSTSWYNMAEVDELVMRISEFLNHWPPGEFRQNDIGVVTAEDAQVTRIRIQLRKAGLKDVNVVVPMAIQGKEFLAIFISTVRSRHMMLEKNTIIEDDDRGFLTNSRLLNTALTRTKFFVAVVGDPVALCTIGSCSTIWMKYIDECHTLNSMVPTHDEVMQDIYMAEESMESNPNTHPGIQTSQAENQTRSIGQEEGLNLEADEILLQLGMHAKKIRLKDVEMYQNQHNIDTSKINVSIQEKMGHAVPICIDSSETDSHRKLLSAEDCNKDYETDSSDSDAAEEKAKRRRKYQEVSVKDLEMKLRCDPSQYKRCILQITSLSMIRAKVIASTDGIHEIAISSRRRCGRAFHNDEVCVLIKPIDEEDRIFTEDGKNDDFCIPQGEVVGVLKRTMDIRYTKFVCTVDESNTGRMVPLNIGFPPMINVAGKERLGKNIKPEGAVCVYTFTKNKEVRFRCYENATKDDGSQQLFLVRFLKWEPHFWNPLCIVVGTFPMCLTVNDGLAVLDIEYFVPGDFKRTTYNAVRKLPRAREQRGQSRTDLCNLYTFTIDPDGSNDMDDALSIEKMYNGCFKIGIHITDVSYLVEKDSVIDKEARSRCTTYYPAGKAPITMLPEELSNDICSLKPEKERKTISLLLTVDGEGKITQKHITRGFIRSRVKLTYHEAEIIIAGKSSETCQELNNSIRRLNAIAEMWREERLGDESHFHNLDKDSEDSPKAHLMVQEMMIVANKEIARTLMESYPQCVPLRSQLPPNQLVLQLWRQKFEHVARNTFLLKRPFLPDDKVCRCNDDCVCIPSEDDTSFVGINETLWENLLESIEFETCETSCNHIGNPQLIPEATVALGQLRKLQERGEYICSGDASESTRLHYSLQANVYTHFTSPIRRYIDLVVHRLVVAHLKGQPCPYNQEEISEICRKCTDVSQRARRYEAASERLQMAVVVKKCPATIHSVVDEVKTTSLQINYPGLSSIPTRFRKLLLSKLHPHGEPFVTDEYAKITWAERIYDADSRVETCDEVDMNSGGRAYEIKIKHSKLNPSPFVSYVPAVIWRKLLRAVRSRSIEGVRTSCREINDAMQSNKSTGYVDDVSSEQMEIAHKNQICYFSREIWLGSILKVQLSTEVMRGFLVPSIQLLNLTPTLDICIEHRTDPVLCFADVNKNALVKRSYETIQEYKEGWLYCVAIEAANASVKGEKSIILHNVKIIWTREYDGEISGSFLLPTGFCDSRYIKFTTQDEEEGDDDEDISLDYFCIRYGNIEKKPVRTGTKLDAHIPEFGKKSVWVAHCTSVETKMLGKSKDTTKVMIRLLQSKVLMPSEVKATDRSATVEFMSKTIPSRSEERALRSLTEDTDDALLYAIALNKPIPPMSEAHLEGVKKYTGVTVPRQPPANGPQQEAIYKAMTQSFTLIQGPPGTGKTVTGVRLAYLLAQYNMTRPGGEVRPQLLVCGPSNDSVDVITAYLANMEDDCPKLARVFSAVIEHQEFPLPMDHMMRKSRYIQKTQITQYTLHHMIRSPRECTLANKIIAIDHKIKRYRKENLDMSTAEKTEYNKLIHDAKLQVLKKKEIILCTCHTSSLRILESGTNIKQLIIDECGMCTEPQSMVPIVAARPEQVILIGDHKQLQPVITDPRAKKLGLGISLFERYAEDAHMLTTQYRMHEEIANFPSKWFYENRLESGLLNPYFPSRLHNFWPGGHFTPILFVHVVGKEETLNVPTSEGSEQSKSNMVEVQQVVRIVKQMLDSYSDTRIRGENILVLSQYRAQCAKIDEAIENNEQLKAVRVSTVVAAQGSERDLVVWSTVRSLPKAQIEKRPSDGWSRKNLGFITDENQVNVALTRAKKGLVIIGNKNLLECHPLWQKLFSCYREKNSLVYAADLKFSTVALV